MSIYQPGPPKKPAPKKPAAKAASTPIPPVKGTPTPPPTTRPKIDNSFTLAPPTAQATANYGRGGGYRPTPTPNPIVNMDIPSGYKYGSYAPFAQATSTPPPPSTFSSPSAYWAELAKYEAAKGIRTAGGSVSADGPPIALPSGATSTTRPPYGWGNPNNQDPSGAAGNPRGGPGSTVQSGGLTGAALLAAMAARDLNREQQGPGYLPPAGPPKDPYVAPAAPLVPLVPLDPFAPPNPNTDNSGDTSNLQTDFEKLAMLMQIGKFAPEPPAVDNSFRDQIMTMWQASQAKLEALTADFQSMILQFLKQAQAQAGGLGTGVPLPAAPAGATGNAFPLSNIPAISNMGSNLQLSNAGLGYLNDINPALNRILQQMLAAKKYTDTGQAGQYGPLNYARFGGSGSLSMSDADYENPLNYAGVGASDRESSEAALRMLFSKMGLNA